MMLEIFDVSHGACALLTCDNGSRLMLDCASNPETGWAPGSHLGRLGVSRLEMLAITNYDEDHVRGLPNLLANVDVAWLSRNPSVTPDILRQLKSEDGMGHGIDTLREMAQGFGPSADPLPQFPDVERNSFYNEYPAFDDENNLSLVVHLKIRGVGFLFPGDLERAGWEHRRPPGEFILRR